VTNIRAEKASIERENARLKRTAKAAGFSEELYGRHPERVAQYERMKAEAAKLNAQEGNQ
jgi:hypothetical protein